MKGLWSIDSPLSFSGMLDFVFWKNLWNAFVLAVYLPPQKVYEWHLNRLASGVLNRKVSKSSIIKNSFVKWNQQEWDCLWITLYSKAEFKFDKNYKSCSLKTIQMILYKQDYCKINSNEKWIVYVHTFKPHDKKGSFRSSDTY